MTEVDVVDYLVNSNEELKNTYQVYQDLLYTLQNNDFKVLETSLNNYHNGYIEGNNNFIKVLKKIEVGFRSFRRFKARIMICKGLIIPKIKEA